MAYFFSSTMDEIRKTVLGKDDIVELLLIAILCDGHVLLEGLPGTAKTTLVNNLSKIFNTTFRRIQFTPDLLPSDIIGTYIFNQKKNDFQFVAGPVFTNFLLADEINRSSPKTQSALLESMAEKQVTVSGNTFKLDLPFIVIATQNPIEMEGTYPLPEAQLDRFLFKISVGYPTKQEEFYMLKLKNGFQHEIQKLFDKNYIIKLKNEIKKVIVSDEILVYIVNIIELIRQSPELVWGAGPRASIALLETSKVKAFIDGRNYVIPDDIKVLCCPILRHRIRLQDADIGTQTVDKFIENVLKEAEVPKNDNK